MPITPDHEWEESPEDVVVTVRPKGVAADKVDVYATAAFLKVHAERYLLAVDLRHDVDPDRTTVRTLPNAGAVAITLRKATPGVVWGALRADGDPRDLAVRRERSIRDCEAAHGRRAELRKATKEAEEKRYFHHQWDLEKAQRKEVEERVAEEFREVTRDLRAWEEIVERRAAPGGQQVDEWAGAPREGAPSLVPAPPSPAAGPGNPRPESASGRADDGYEGATPAVRGPATVTVPVTFTPAISRTAPARGSHAEEAYYQSRYRPQDATDTPFHHKGEGDRLYRHRQWRRAADAYSQALKRDPTFAACLCNRSACWLRLPSGHQYAKCQEDASLALNLIGTAPASSTSAEQYRHSMVKLLARRGAAAAWAGDLPAALRDYRAALAHRTDDAPDLALDLQTLEALPAAAGLRPRAPTPAALLRADGDRAFHHQRFEVAVEKYTAAFALDCGWEGLANRAAAYLSLRQFPAAVADCDAIIRHCADVATALADLQRAGHREDSDDEGEGGEGSEPPSAHRVVATGTAHVYRLVKAYVRKGAALCGLRQHPEGLHWLEKALAIVPYDDDLRADCLAVADRIRTDTLVAAAAGRPLRPPPPPPTTEAPDRPT